MLNCLMYKLSYYRFGDMSLGGNPGTDRARGYEIGNKDIELTYLEEAYTSEHWIVRIYRVCCSSSLRANSSRLTCIVMVGS